jgi:putative glycerol-1-phosphate prenyltransferase
MARALHSLLMDAKGSNRTLFAMLIDPDKKPDEVFYERILSATKSGVDLFFVGGSLLQDDYLEETVEVLKSVTSVPVVLFPGSAMQITNKADAILFLSLISGRNPDLLIGQQVVAAPYIKKSGIESMATGYMLIDGGTMTTAHYISQTRPIPSSNIAVAVNTALAGEMLGLSAIYLDCGSGAKSPVSADMIRAVSAAVNIPVIVGGGIRTTLEVESAVKAGATVVVVGNALEQNPSLLQSLIASTTR